MAISTLVTKTTKEDDVTLKQIPYLHYLIRFKKNKVQVLINLTNKGNTMIPAYVFKLSLQVYRINVKAQKIDSSTLNSPGKISNRI